MTCLFLIYITRIIILFQNTWEHEVYLDPQFSFDVADDKFTPVRQGYRDKLWHKDYYDTDPLFKLIKEKEKAKSSSAQQTKFKKNDNPATKNNAKGNSENSDKNGRQRMAIHRSFMELLRKEFLRYKNGVNIFSDKSNLSDEENNNSNKVRKYILKFHPKQMF